MSFGQSGPPATAKQMQYLLALVEKAGYASFREARRPLGLTQRQGSGKFTRSEASSMIDRLLADPEGEHGQQDMSGFGEQISAADRLEAERAAILQGMPAGLLAAELERRGWQTTPPA